MTTRSPIEAGRAAFAAQQDSASNPYELDAPTVSERANALAWIRAYRDSNPMPLWDNAADPDADAPVLGRRSTGWRRARLFEEYVQKRYGPDIQVSAGHDAVTIDALVIGRGDRLEFLERTDSGRWGGCSADPDIARTCVGGWETTADTTTAAIAEAVTLLDPTESRRS